MDSPVPVRIAKWLGLAYAAGLTAYWLSFADIDGPGALIFLLITLCWQIGPAAVAAMLVKASRTPSGAWLFLSIEIAVILSTLSLLLLSTIPLLAVGAFVIAAFVAPLFQYGAVAAVFLLAFLFGWRASDGWLNN